MRFYNHQHQYYCGIDLHVKTMYVCILDATGQVLVHRNVPSSPEALLATVAPYRDDLVVAAECMFTWYWLADVCAAEGITFVLGHALAMKAIHGGKAKNDKIDSQKIAGLLRGGLLPQAYAYPCRRSATWKTSPGFSAPTLSAIKSASSGRAIRVFRWLAASTSNAGGRDARCASRCLVELAFDPPPPRLRRGRPSRRR